MFWTLPFAFVLNLNGSVCLLNKNQDREETAHKLARETEKLVNGGFTDMEDTQATATQLQTNMQLLRQRVEERKKLLIETLTYYRNNERVSNEHC